MKKLFEWTKKWSFLIVMLSIGVVYFTQTDGWQVYAKPIARAEQWLGEVEAYLQPENNKNPISGSEQAGGMSDNGFEQTEFGATEAQGNTGTSAETAPSEELPQIQETPLPTEAPITYRNPEDVVYYNVEDDYFTDVLFIGDSRTVGMYEYGGLEEVATFYASTGLTVHKMFSAPVVEVPGQKKKMTIEEALQEKQFAKIYLMIGINEMGTGNVETFMEKYREAVAHLQELQPDAIIYLQGIMKVTTERSEQGDYIHNEGIEERNAEIAKLADNVKVYYLDVNPLVCDETGGMEPSYTFDGVHLKAQYTGIWKEFLKEHAVDCSIGE